MTKHYPLLSLFLLLVVLSANETEAAGTLSIKFKWFRNNAHTDENYQYCDSYWDECDSSFYACTDPSIECSRADISGNHGSHHESNVDEGEFQNNNPFTAYYPPSGITLRVDVWDDDYNHDDKIDRCRVTIRDLIPGNTVGKDCNGERSDEPTTLRLEYTLTCHEGFGGPNCECEAPTNGYCKADGTVGCNDEDGMVWGTPSTRCDRLCEEPPNGLCDFSLPAPYIRCKETWRGPPECDQYDCPTERDSCNDASLCAEDGCGHGTCVLHEIRYGYFTIPRRRCECDEGWESSTCELDIDECSPTEDLHECEQVCINNDGSYSCDCDSGFSLDDDGLGCTDIDECIKDLDECEQLCMNTIGSYTCACRDGYILKEPERRNCSDVDECDMGTHQCGHLCENTIGSYTCHCHSGYRLNADGFQCDDIDECDEGSSGCSQICTNEVPFYMCSCKVGYKLSTDEHDCLDINECESGNGGCGHTCHNSIGSYSCSCRTGYQLNSDLHGCSDIDECATDNGGCSEQCDNTVGSFFCSCQFGYFLQENGLDCEEFELATALRADPPVNPTFLADITSVSSSPCNTGQCIIDILLHLQTEGYFEHSSYVDPVFTAEFDHNKVVSMTDVMKAVFNTDLTGTAFPFNPILGRFTFNKNTLTSSFEPISIQDMQEIFPRILTTTNMRLTVTMLGASNPGIIGMLLSGTGLLGDMHLTDVTLDSTQRKWVISGTANVHAMPLKTLINKLHKGFKTTLDISAWHIDVDSVNATFDTEHQDFHLVMNVHGTLHIGNWRSMRVCIIGNLFVLRQRNNEMAIVTHCNSEMTGSFTLGDVLQNVAQVNIGPVPKLFRWDIDHFRLFLTGTPSFTLDDNDAQLIGIDATCASVLAEATGSGILIDLPMKSPNTSFNERYDPRSGNEWCYRNTEPVKTSPLMCHMGMPVFIRFDSNESTFIPIKYSSAIFYYRTFVPPKPTNITIEEVLTNGLGGCGIYTSRSGLLNGSGISIAYNYSTFSYAHQNQAVSVQSPILANLTFVKGFVVMENPTLVVNVDFMRTPGPVYSANILGPFQLLNRSFAGNISLDLKENAWELKGCASGMTTRVKFMTAVNVSAPSTIIMKFFNFAEFDLHEPCVHVSSAEDGFHGVVEGGVCFGGKQHPTPEDAFSSVASFSQCLSAADSYAQSSQVMGWELVGSPLSSLLQPVLGDAAGQIPFLNVRYLTAVLYAEGDYDGPSPIGELLGQLEISEGLTIVLRMSWPLNCGDMCAYLRNTFGDNISFQLEVNVAFELNVGDPSALLPPKPTKPSLRRQNALNPEPNRGSTECGNDDTTGGPADLDTIEGKNKLTFDDFLGVSAALAVTITFRLPEISFENYKFTDLQFQTEVGVDFANKPPDVCVSISLGMTVVFTNPNLTLFGQIALVLPDRILELTAAVDICWDVTDTFSICDFYLFVSINIRQPKMSGFALSVTFYLGDRSCIGPQDRLAITAAFGIQPNFMYLSVAGNFTFGGIMGYYCIDTKDWPDLILVSGFPKGFTLSWAEEEVYIDYYNIEVKEGWYFQGTVSIMGYEIYGEIHDNRPNTMSISAVLEPVTFASGLVRMSASRNDTKMGPYFYSFFDFTALPLVATVNISGYVQLLGWGLQATMVADNTRFFLSLDGWLWGALEVHLEFEANYDIGNLGNLGYRVSGYIKVTLKKTIEDAVNLFFRSRANYVEEVAGEQLDYVDQTRQRHQGAIVEVNDTEMTLQTEQANERVHYFDLQDSADFLNAFCPANFDCQECARSDLCAVVDASRSLTLQPDDCCFKYPSVSCYLSNVHCLLLQEAAKAVLEQAAALWNAAVQIVRRVLQELVEAEIFEGEAQKWLESAVAELDKYVIQIPEDFSFFSKLGSLIASAIGSIIDLREVAWSVEARNFAGLKFEVCVTVGFFGNTPQTYGPIRFELPNPRGLARKLACAAFGFFCDNETNYLDDNCQLKKTKRSLHGRDKPLRLAQYYKRSGNPFGKRMDSTW